MNEDMGIPKILKLRYSYRRIEWLVGTISVIAIVYLTSEEIWKLVDLQPFPEIDDLGMIMYVACFLVVLLIVHSIDVKRITKKRRKNLVISLISIGVDLATLSLSEFIVLATIQVLPQNTLGLIFVLLIGALPASLGVVVLTSLSEESLKKRSEVLYKEMQELRKEAEKLDEKRKGALENFKTFNGKLSKIEHSLKNKKQTGDQDDK